MNVPLEYIVLRAVELFDIDTIGYEAVPSVELEYINELVTLSIRWIFDEEIVELTIEPILEVVFVLHELKVEDTILQLKGKEVTPVKVQLMKDTLDPSNTTLLNK